MNRDDLAAALRDWVPQHSSACAAQDDDADCICGTSAVYVAALAALPVEDGLEELRAAVVHGYKRGEADERFGRGHREDIAVADFIQEREDRAALAAPQPEPEE